MQTQIDARKREQIAGAIETIGVGGHFETDDLYLAGALMTAGHPLVRIDRRGARAWFIFPWFAEPGAFDVAETAGRFYAGNLAVDARAYADNVKALKNGIYFPKGGR